MRLSLFVPCFIDLFAPEAAIAAVSVLERLGHTVDFAEDVVCCGQPPFNAGYWPEARTVAQGVLKSLRHADTVVILSGSCGAMVRNFYPQLFAGTPLHDEALALAARTWEFSQFLVDRLNVTDVGARFHATVTFLDGCHGLRELGVRDQPRALLAHVKDLTVVEMPDAQTCCGFGGLFAVKFGEISSAMGEQKVVSATGTCADYLVSNDVSCLMHLQGLIDRHHAQITAQSPGRKLAPPMRGIHLAQVLAGVKP
jgi:L-lactate dehydrogenase complex protein LldE